MADDTDEISRDDLRASFQSLKDGIDQSADEAASKAEPFAAAAGVILLILVFLAGRRVGRTKSTVVEIRRI